MKSLRVCLVLASLLVLSASPLQAQASKISCKDGTQPKGGHFSCWGHGGIVAGAVKPAAKTAAKPAGKAAKKKAGSAAKRAAAKKAHSAAAKADRKKAGKTVTAGRQR
jgi:hypothetical protein